MGLSLSQQANLTAKNTGDSQRILCEAGPGCVMTAGRRRHFWRWESQRPCSRLDMLGLLGPPKPIRETIGGPLRTPPDVTRLKTCLVHITIPTAWTGSLLQRLMEGDCQCFIRFCLVFFGRRAWYDLGKELQVVPMTQWVHFKTSDLQGQLSLVGGFSFRHVLIISPSVWNGWLVDS